MDEERNYWDEAEDLMNGIDDGQQDQQDDVSVFAVGGIANIEDIEITLDAERYGIYPDNFITDAIHYINDYNMNIQGTIHEVQDGNFHRYIYNTTDTATQVRELQTDMDDVQRILARLRNDVIGLAVRVTILEGTLNRT